MPTPPPDLAALQTALDTAIFRELPASHASPELARFYALLRDYPERGGKRLRGLVLLLSVAAHGAPWERGLGVAAALELFQNWVLIHDDIEDDSEDRRGSPALHKQVGLPVALNVGDALHIYMWRTLLRSAWASWAQQQRVVTAFENAITRTAEGQHLDLSWVAEGRFDVSETDYLEMVTLKSAYYTVVGPLTLGALCADPDAEPSPGLTDAGRDLGVAFQIRDDVLNLTDGVSYGKEFAGDLFEGKRTLVLAHFLAHAAPEHKGEVQRVLAKPRAEKTRAEVTRVLSFVRQSGSLEYAQGVAEEKAATGMMKLRTALERAPNQAAAEMILELLGRVAERQT